MSVCYVCLLFVVFCVLYFCVLCFCFVLLCFAFVCLLCFTFGLFMIVFSVGAHTHLIPINSCRSTRDSKHSHVNKKSGWESVQEPFSNVFPATNTTLCTYCTWPSNMCVGSHFSAPTTTIITFLIYHEHMLESPPTILVWVVCVYTLHLWAPVVVTCPALSLWFTYTHHKQHSLTSSPSLLCAVSGHLLSSISPAIIKF